MKQDEKKGRRPARLTGAHDATRLRQATEEWPAIRETMFVDKADLGLFSTACLVFNCMTGLGIFTGSSVVFYSIQNVRRSLFLLIDVVVFMITLSGLVLCIHFRLTIHRWEEQNSARLSRHQGGGDKDYYASCPSPSPKGRLMWSKYLATCLFGISLIFYGNTASNSVAFGVAVLQAAGVAGTEVKVVGIAVAVSTFAYLLRGKPRRWAIRLNNLLGSLKLLMLALIVIVGVSGYANFKPAAALPTAPKTPAGVHVDAELLAFVLVIQFGGSQLADYVLAEIDGSRGKSAGRYSFRVAALCILFLLINTLYATIIPIDTLFQPSVDVAQEFFKRTLGPPTADTTVVKSAAASFRALSALSNVITLTLTPARVKQEVAKESVLSFELRSDERVSAQLSPFGASYLEAVAPKSKLPSLFRENYLEFFSRSALGPSQSRTMRVGVVRTVDSGNAVSWVGSQGLRVRKAFAALRRLVRRLTQSSAKAGYIRIEWTCECGDDLCADFPEADGKSIRDLERFLGGEADNDGECIAGPCQAPSRSGPPGHTPPTGGPPSSTPAPTSPPSAPSQQQGMGAGQASRQQLNTLPYGQRSESTGSGVRKAETAPGGARKRFLELCVNTGEFQRQLAEIDVSSVESDGQLFSRIRERYHEVRSFRAKYFLLKPVDVHFVHFSVEDRHRVGILDKPMAIPSQAEMAAQGYAYYPCPLKPPPVPANIFLHHLSNPGPHKKLLWGSRLPQKLDRSILQMQSPEDALVLGWGVHIIEGLNRSAVLMCTLAGLLVSGVVSTAWAVARDDVQGGFGIGAWLTSVEAIVLMLVVTKWMET